MQQGMAAKKEDDADAAERMFAAAARFYKQAAEMYPPDDEYFPCAWLSLSPRFRCPNTFFISFVPVKLEFEFGHRNDV